MLEVLLVVGTAVIIFLFSSPYSLNFYRSNLIDDARSNVIDALQRAERYAILQKNDSDFGVRLMPGSYTIFQGLNYGDNPALDEVYPLIDNITFSTTTVTFSKFTGLPGATGTITMFYDTISRGILIDDSGVISKTN